MAELEQIIDENIRKYMRKSYHNRRQDPTTARNEPVRILSVDNGYTAIRLPVQAEESTGRYEIALPEIPYREEEATKPIMLFVNYFPKNNENQYIEDVDLLGMQQNRLIRDEHYELSSSNERPHVITIKDRSDQIWRNVKEIHYLFYGLGSVLNASDFDHFQNKSIKTEFLESEEGSFDRVIANHVVAKEIHDDLDIGVIKMWGSSVLPKNSDGTSDYLFCEGQSITKADCPKLFSAWGITSSSTNLPDMRGRSPMGVSHGANIGNGEFANIGLREKKGTYTYTLSVEQLPSHGHNVPFGKINIYEQTSGNHRVVTTATSGLDRGSDPTGGGKAFDILHPVVGVYFIVKVR